MSTNSKTTIGPSIEDKRTLLAELLKKKARAPKRFPLSFAQQRLWVLDQLNPGSPLYNIPVAVELKGKLDVAVLQRSLNEVIRRHEMLRTTFAMIDHEPVQIIAPDLNLSLPVIDLRESPGDPEAEARRLVNEEAGKPFDLAHGPLIRASLLRLSPDKHIALFTMHHIISDDWSMGVLVRELTTLYAAYLDSVPSPLPELPIQYVDFALWQRRWLTGEVLEKQLSYWRRQLASVPVLQLPIDHARPAIQTFNGARETLALPKALSDGLNALSRRHGVTLFMILLAAWQVLLSRYSGQKDIAVGSVSAGRSRLETEALIGFFINTLVLRTDLSGNPAFSEVLRRVKDMTLDAYAHQDIPFEKIVEELNPERSLSYTPLFQAGFALQNNNAAAVNLPGLSVTRIENEEGQTKVEVMLTIENTNELKAVFEYNTELFQAAMIERLARNFQTLLEGIVRNPELRISELPLLTTEETTQVLLHGNWQPQVAYDKCAHEVFEEHVRRRPDNVAVVFEADQLTYGELNERANRLAHYLRNLGVGPEITVGLCLERSIEMIVGLLGILKAGGVYLPLDPQYPMERLSFMLEDAAVSVLLTQEHLLDQLPDHRPQVVCLDADWDSIAAQAGENVGVIVAPENLAYVLYTSGSTGKPKGVGLTHRNAVRKFKEPDYVDYRPEEVFLQVSTISFDASIIEIFGSLLNGARLVIMSPGLPTLAELGLAIKRHEITTLFLVTGLFHLMVDERPEDLAGLRQLLTGGDCLSVPHAKKAFDELKGVRVINFYGPTEITNYASYYQLNDADDISVSVPIGQPVANHDLYVFDDTMRLVPEGVIGELYIGGDSVTRGYLNRAELTAERFVPHPFAMEAGLRLYRTGDRVRYLPNGCLRFLGRADNQVKVRGFRVELGEIETVLGSHGAVSECVVVALEDVAGDKRLVAYAAAAPESEISASELREYLQEKLPEYMAPSAVILLDELPITPNGKVDRQALPAPNDVQQEREQTYLAPRSPIEELLAGIWAEMLGRERVGVDDNFFVLGGHSLLGTKLISRVRDMVQVDIGLRQLFDTPKLRGFADAVAEAQRAGRGLMAPPIVPVPRDRALPLSFAQLRLWFLDQLSPNSSLYNIPLALRLTGELQLGVLESTLNEIVRRHEVLRTTFAVEDGEPVQTIAPSLTLPLPVLDLTALPVDIRDTEVTRLVREEAQRPFDLGTGPLVRATLLRLSEQEHVGLLTMHHIISDGWSMAVLIKEVATLYEAFAAGKPSPLPDLSIQYADFAYWQREWLSGAVLDQELVYWKRQLDGIPTLLELPTDRRRPAVPTFEGDRVSGVLSPELTQTLKELSLREKVTLFMTLLAAFQVLLSRYTSRHDIVVGTPIANRNHSETEDLIGFFVNTIALRVDLAGNPTFRELLVRVREAALGAYAHQDVPFEKLVEELQPERNPSHSPLFQVFFTLQNASESSLKLPALELQELEFQANSAKFDLVLLMTEADGGLAFSFEYNVDLFEAATIKRMVSHYETLLHGIVADPNSAIFDLPLLSERERQQLLIEWNDTAQEFYSDTTLHELFEAQVARTPDAVAVVYQDQQFTYQELNERANQLGHHLQALGVGAESLVGIMLERSLALVVGVLGILKAGGAYVPLDPAYPRERLGFMLSDAAVSVLVTEQALLDALPEHETRLVLLDADWEEIAGHSRENPVRAVLPEQLAYVIYTSGSTGRPKGALITHANVTQLLAATEKQFGFGPGDVVTMFHSYGFDFSVWELWGALAYGGRLVVVPYWVSRSPVEFAELLQREGVTVLSQTPSAFQQLLRLEEEGGPLVGPGLRVVIFGGEALELGSLRGWFERHGEERPQLVNMYGITETTVHVTYRALREADASGGGSVIGRGLEDLRVYVLDPGQRLVPVGVSGELYVGGAGLGRGYLQRAELTAERFVPNPYAAAGGERLYRSGDLVRWTTGGELEYLGRADAQVKIRGFRIELGEIEAALRDHPGVREAAVVQAPGPNEDQRLIGYVVPSRYEGSESAQQLLDEADELFHERFQGKTLNAQLRRLTDVIREEKIEQIDLLKIDVERSEADVLRGLESDDWKRIRQIVVQVHDHVDDHTAGRLTEMIALLEFQGYDVVVEEQSQLKETGIYSLYARRDGMSGEEIETQIGQRTLNSVVTTNSLRQWLNVKLPAYMIPSAFVMLEQLPLTTNGKLDRRALPAPEQEASMVATYVAPRDIFESELVQLWEELLGVTPVGVTTDFFDLGGHSLMAAKLARRIERRMGIKLPLATLFRVPTVAQMADYLRRQPTVQQEPELIVLQRGDNHLRPLFLVHPVATSMVYSAMTRHLDPAQPFYVFQPRLLGGEPPHIESMAARYVGELRAVQPEGPYMLGGWSIGGTVAFEMARQLASQGERVSLLALLDTHVVRLGEHPELDDEVGLLKGFSEDLRLSLDGLDVSTSHFFSLEPDDRLAYILEQVKAAGMIDADTSFEQIRFLFQLFKANLRAMRNYEPQPYPGRITLFRAEDQVDATKDWTNGWDGLADEIAVHVVRGDHLSMMQEPHLATLVEELKASLYGTVKG